MFEHEGDHIGADTELGNVASIDTVHTVDSEDSFLGVEDLFFSFLMINFQDCEFVLMKKLLQIVVDEIQQR